jgi:FkbM family methyltransferase
MADVYRRLSQGMLNGLTRFDPVTAQGQLELLAWRGLRKQLLRLADPVVTYSFEGRRIDLPFSHDLPLIRQVQPQYMTNVTRVARLVASKYSAAPAVDIGANVGDTILAIRQGAALPVLGVEGNSQFYQLLRSNVASLPDVELDQSFVGYGAEVVAGSLQAQHGTASLVPSADAAEIIRSKPLIEILRAHPRFLEARLLKVDTDGLDCAILKAALEWLARARPVIYFEYDPAAYARYDPSGFEVFARLRETGYTGALVWDNRGDYLLACDLANTRLLDDLHHFYTGRRSKAYCDIAVFHGDDGDLMQTSRAAEIDFFAEFRRAR